MKKSDLKSGLLIYYLPEDEYYMVLKVTHMNPDTNCLEECYDLFGMYDITRDIFSSGKEIIFEETGKYFENFGINYSSIDLKDCYSTKKFLMYYNECLYVNKKGFVSEIFKIISKTKPTWKSVRETLQKINSILNSLGTV